MHDVNFAFKCSARDIYRQINLTSEGSFIDAEFLFLMTRRGARLAEIGLNYYPRVAGVSTLGGGKAALQTFREMVKFRRQLHEQPTHNADSERRQLRPKSGDQPRDSAGVPGGNPAERQLDAERTSV